MSEPSWINHVSSGSTWRRFGFMLIFLPILACAGFLILLTALFQFFGVLANGEANLQLRNFGSELARFSAAIIEYLTYNTEHRPFPFSSWNEDNRREKADDVPHENTRRQRTPPRPRRHSRRPPPVKAAGADKAVATESQPGTEPPDSSADKPQAGSEPDSGSDK